MNELPDDVEAFLNRPAMGVSPELRRRLLDETSVLLPRRRWAMRRRVALVAAVVVFAAGVGWFVTRREAVVVVQPELVTRSVEKVYVSAVDLEWQAFDGAAKDQASLYWTAGQTYLGDHGDHESALRCYRQALETGTAESRQITDEDDVLAMALKMERTYQEKSP